MSIANIQDDPVASDRTAFDSEHQPATRSTPPIYNIPSPNCTHSGKTFAQQRAEGFIDYFCDKKEWWNYIFAPPISLGLDHTSDGRKKMAAAGAGYSIPGTGDSVWIGLRFSRDSCSGFFPFTLGNTDGEKADHCKKRFRAILNGCGTDTVTTKKEGMLVDGCRVYQIAVAANNPFTVDELYKDQGDLICKDNDKSLKGTCICNYAGYPGLTDVFERPASNSCEAGDVDLKKLVIN
ncbi:uncharacterized protein BDZ83DRAFT_591747 [Colletotrichum acutatum]|uniref:Uncharacterized protein n=1 Tax=Glomerella acutata TaxID=27357 RepID=A0AAD8U9P7_GLOAC|nr:uncharacterized protein BDZ83DRAFT_591747 [Colletotrichum acutatum]KAK1709737.1 hypothetical protein BDZ83DRAFT_591747 [Colletotrichum acutatum]